ncbi:hypothetical protein GCM10020218_025970 [Dactylosporangium vinaceum]|uniref:TMEM175 family protein n=1 Tax=Dactylosporangium vinaceum TaxID=53362 RepID=A0ABV5MKV7_9ACTN|nr:TMEM175 family protein [Dactylosporangium vinaceum]
MQPERLRTLADGIFAIALTLLVLELPVPLHSTDLGHDLLPQWPFYAAYVVSFVTLGIVWMNYHALLDGVGTVDRALVELNLLLLLFVAVVPWPTGLLAEYLREPDGQSSAAAITYGAVMTAMSGTFTLIWIRLARARDLLHPRARTRLRGALRRSAVGPAAYAASTVIAVFNATTAFVLFAAVAVYFALSARRRPTEPAPG